MEHFIDNLAKDGTEEADATLIMNPLVTETVDNDALVVHSPSDASSSSLDSPNQSLPEGDRWAIANNGVDLSGDWQLSVTVGFKKEYDAYLEKLGQPKLVRSVALGIVAQTTEKLEQTDQGRSLLIVGRNIRGTWSRTLIASGSDMIDASFDPILAPMISADSENVEAESWWENNGSVHVSWMRGVTKYGGGSFQSRRYLEDDDTVYVCESAFVPNEKSRQPIKLTWKFERQKN